MSDNVWVSTRLPDGRTVTVGGVTVAAMVENLMDLYEQDQAKVNRVLDAFEYLVDPPQPPAPTENNKPAPSAPSSGGGAAPPGAPFCDHGPRAYKDAFTSRAGKSMPSSWQCQSKDRNSQCKAIWNDN
jgi:hypothetical protein